MDIKDILYLSFGAIIFIVACNFLIIRGRILERYSIAAMCEGEWRVEKYFISDDLSRFGVVLSSEWKNFPLGLWVGDKDFNVGQEVLVRINPTKEVLRRPFPLWNWKELLEVTAID